MTGAGRHHVVIVGNGAAALAAVESFRRLDQRSRVSVVSAEACTAYSRVLLPYYLRGKVPYSHLFIRDEAFYKSMDVELIQGRRVEAVDVCSSRLELGGGRTLPYDRLLLAPGSRPVRPPVEGLGGPEIHHLWHLEEAVRLDFLFRPGARAFVLGAGFVALQGAWSALKRGLTVTILELADRILSQVLDATGSAILQERIAAHGVGLHLEASAQLVERTQGSGLCISGTGFDPMAADVLIVGTGVRPNDHLLPHSVEPGTRGILVNERMETVVEDIYAAGDVVRGPVFDDGPPRVHALWPTAVEHGRVAGTNLAGGRALYEGSLNMNVTEMFGTTVASLGRFVESGEDDVIVYEGLPGADYLKVVLRGGVPVGAVALGGQEGARALGLLRPYVRRHSPVPDLDALLSGEPAIVRLTRDRSAKCVAPKEDTAMENVRCAS